MKVMCLYGDSMFSTCKSQAFPKQLCYGIRAEGGKATLQELNRTVEHIEEHLIDELYLEKISEHAGVSNYHFRMVFSYLAEMTLGEYVKSRRLLQTNRDLPMGEEVTDIVCRYSYGSMDGFARASKK